MAGFEPKNFQLKIMPRWYSNNLIEGSRSSTAVKRTPAEQDSLGRGFKSCPLLFFLFYSIASLHQVPFRDEASLICTD